MGKGGGKQRTPYEAPNDLTSRQKLSIVDLVSEGPIEGPVGDLKGVYLNNTPVIDSSGNSNVNGMTAQWVSGTLEQPALEGFSSSSSETPVGIEIKKSTPVTRTITSRNIDRLRLTFGTQTLVEVKDNGDRVPTAVELQIQVQRNGAWVTEKNLTIRGKRSNSPYLTAVIIDNLPSPPFSIRMVRITPDSDSDKLQNNTIWSSYTEITDINQTYPGSAVAGLTFESEQFGNQYPSRSYLIRGRIVQVPDNYNPETREYSGIWSGTFKPAYTNNPAWVLYDLLTNPRAGLGKRLKLSEIDKFALYVIGQYCDQSVPDGFGGTEPRVTCNAYITDIRKAYDFFQDLCSQMRVMFAWNGQMLTFIQDRPSDVVWPYTNANVVAGRFNYSFSPAKARHNIIEVRFIDPENGWKTSIEQVTDDALVAQFGPNVLRLDAFGCTSRGQARRYGLWVLMTEKLETQTVEFDVGAEGLRHTPGDIIEIMDNDWVGGEDPISGRLIDINATQKVLTLDREIAPPKSGSIFITLMNGTGKYERVKITGYLSNNQIKVEAVPKGLKAKTIWGINPSDLARRLFRAITISDKGDGTYSIIAVQHVPDKEAIVDQGVKFEPLPNTPLGGYIPPVENLSVEISADSDNWQVEANWTTATAIRGVDFILKLTQAGRIVGTAKTQENRYRIGNLPQGNYLLSVAPQNKDGQKGEQASVSFDINPPPPPSYIDVEPGFFSLGIIPHVGGQNALRLQYEFWFSEKQIANINEVELLTEYLGNGTMWVIQGRKLKAGQTYYVYVRTVNPVGKSQFVEASGKPEDRADEILEVIGDKFLSNEAGQIMQDQIDFSKNEIEVIAREQLEIKQNVVDIDEKTIELDTATKELSKKTVELESSALDVSNKVLQLNTDVNIVSEAVMQNTVSLNQVTFRLMEEEGTRKAEILDVREIIIDDQKAFARYQSQVSSQFEYVAADVYNLQQSLATTNEAFAQQMSQVRADLNTTNEGMGKIAARVTTNEEATANLEKSQAKFEQVTLAEFEYQRAYINQISTAFSDSQMSISESVMQLSAQHTSLHDRTLKAEAKITKTEKAVADESKARAEMGVQMDARFGDAEGAIARLDEVQSEQGKTFAQTTEQLRSEIKTGDEKLQEGLDNQGRELSDISSAVDSQKQTIANLEQTTTEAKETQQSNYNELHSNIVNLQQTQASESAANAESALQIAAQVNNLNDKQLASEAHIRRNDKAIAEQGLALAKSETEILARVGDNTARIAQVDKTVSDLESTTAEHAKEISAQFKETDAKLLENQQAIASEKEARALSEQGLNARIGKAESSIAQSFEAISDVDKAQTEKSEQLKTELDESIAVINAHSKTLTTLEASTTELGQQQISQYEETQSSIANLQQTIANAEAASAESVLQTAAQTTLLHDENLKVNARVTHQESVIVDQSKAQAKLEEKVDAQYADNQASIIEIKNSVAEQEQSQAEKTEQVRAELKKDIDKNTGEINKTNNTLSDVSAAVTTNTKAIAATDKTLTEKTEQANSRFEDNEASLANVQKTQANADSTNAETTLQLAVQQNQQGTELLRAKASIRETNKIVVDNDKAYAQKFTQLDSQFEQVNARFARVESTLADAQQSITETKEQLYSEINSVDRKVTAVDQKVDQTKATLEGAIAESNHTLSA
ncbi:TipJ family phage tail tip protein, partial [Providencia manganoxydans]|uniref:TipJ family phage tail tip protein n=1 Tax=Providencia manganoxydans TaxID=2923283 RepID=UPI0032DB1CEA